jgi:hypothetical protein
LDERLPTSYHKEQHVTKLYTVSRSWTVSLERRKQPECLMRIRVVTSGTKARGELHFLCGVEYNRSLAAAKELIGVMRAIELDICQRTQGP